VCVRFKEREREPTMRLWLLSEMKSLLLRASIASFPGNFNGDVNKRGSLFFSKLNGIGVLDKIFFLP
jgi:hypothetical protein